MQKAQPALVSFAACCPRSSNGEWEICTWIMMASTLKGPISPKKSKDPPSYKITPGSFFRLFYHPYQEYWADPRNWKCKFQVPFQTLNIPCTEVWFLLDGWNCFHLHYFNWTVLYLGKGYLELQTESGKRLLVVGLVNSLDCTPRSEPPYNLFITTYERHI